MVDSTSDQLANLNFSDVNSPNLLNNLPILSPHHVDLAKMLVRNGQIHLFDHWPQPGVDDDQKVAFFDQVARLDASYPGGLVQYIKNARELLADSKAGKNPFDGFTPSVPTGENLTFADDNFIKYEETGVKEAKNAAFVLVAGGLGERLGYNGIKVALPSETSTGTCFLQLYIEYILALQEASCKLAEGEPQKEIPFAIMTSDDTHARTLALLESNAYFGMKSTQVSLLKQEKVACLADNVARLAMDPENKYRIQTKPHGHGDVHSLLYSSGLLSKWHDAGVKWVLFFQDTNGLLFKYHVNSLAVPRKAKEAIGGIAKLTHADGRTMVINVEYNQLDPLLRATINPKGDVNCETGFSPFPGNINQLILELESYIEELKKTGGAIKEFVNPKYKDATKTSFKSSTRLECMMQDYPKTLPPTARVGFTVMDIWLAYAPVKNNPEDAAKAGVEIGDPITHVFNGQEVEVWPRIVWKPKWALTFSDVKRKIGGCCTVFQNSTMVIKGRNIFIERLSLDGALVVDSIDDAEVTVEGSVQNSGWMLEDIDHKDTSMPEEIRIRGFRINKVEQFERNFHEHGKYSLKP
ncbi:UDP-sugar pyrophosphorylase [Bienertia sinuspersici]